MVRMEVGVEVSAIELSYLFIVHGVHAKRTSRGSDLHCFIVHNIVDHIPWNVSTRSQTIYFCITKHLYGNIHKFIVFVNEPSYQTTVATSVSQYPIFLCISSRMNYHTVLYHLSLHYCQIDAEVISVFPLLKY